MPEPPIGQTTPAQHLALAEELLRHTVRPEIQANPMVSALYTLQALTHATIAQTQLTVVEHFDRGMHR